MGTHANYELALKNLEQQELSLFGQCPAQVYAEMLSIYLLLGDLYQAKFLWKRIPSQMKQSSPELKAIWAVAQQLLLRDYPQIYAKIDEYTWPDFLKGIMQDLRAETQQQLISLVGRSYSYIRLSELQTLLAINDPQQLQALFDRTGWHLDPQDANGVLIVAEKTQHEPIACNQKELAKLAEYVSFLEN